MKIRNMIRALLPILLLIGIYKAEAINKMQPKIVEVRGNLPQKHTVVKTIITYTPNQSTKMQPFITRSVIGEPLVYIADNPTVSKTSIATDVVLRAPEKEVELKSNIPAMIAIIAGAVTNSPAPAIAKVALATNKITREYGIDPVSFQILEILPNQYYRIDTSTGKLQTTQFFDKDLVKYTELMKKYIPANTVYKAALETYNKAQNQFRLEDPLHQDTNRNNELRKMFEEKVKPALSARLEIENELTKYDLYKYTIIAVNSTPGTSCETVNCKGPWKIFIYFYLGAKQTNVFEIDYCVPDPNKTQNFIVELATNSLRFVASSNIYFPKQEGAEKINLKNMESRWLKWNDQILIHEWRPEERAPIGFEPIVEVGTQETKMIKIKE